MPDSGPPPASFSIRAATAADAPVLGVLHAAAFTPRHERPWPADELKALLALPGVHALLAEGDEPLGMILIQAVAGEAEILTVAVRPDRRRQGVGRRLLDAALSAAAKANATAMILEVARDNTAALGLYHRYGFALRGQRPRYYNRTDGTTADALILGRSVARDVASVPAR
ncbi:ribosomal protein S18-alanine N-acetyltransferase [Pararhodospirillum oryzae]|uniref:N-acetyltransferase GCN5 n=1 Tax=Pararhodospirillum oryzae TaxID=478448 RepID=A0A512H6X0_9PROT|nr:ribosomal protein S18-alanine N-acetyltransferase [Pararhodospirillum oryzae]GEO81197.1 N-acetyltransferase GCN5 [Pararhodospirillum oryzae]